MKNSPPPSPTSVPATPQQCSPLITPSTSETPRSPTPPTPLPTLPLSFLEKSSTIPETPEKPTTAQPVQKPSDGSLGHSEAAQTYLGKRTPHNTVRSNVNSLRVFCRFVVTICQLTDEQEDGDVVHDRGRRILFHDVDGTVLPYGFNEWTDAQLKNIRFYLIEFVVNYRSSKTKQEVMSSTMRGYISGLQRAFFAFWGYELDLLGGPIFAHRKDGLLAVVDNKFSEQQANGDVVKSHNTLSKNDLFKLFSSELLSRQTASGFQARLIFRYCLDHCDEAIGIGVDD